MRSIESVTFTAAGGGLMALVIVEPLFHFQTTQECRTTTTGNIESYGAATYFETVLMRQAVEIKNGAVLGIIKTMGAITEPPAVLGGMIGGALVGTFMGVLLSYCIVGPLASKLNQTIEADSKPYILAKTAIIGYAQSLPVQVAVEIARRMTPSAYAPTFQQLETALDEAKNGLTAQAA